MTNELPLRRLCNFIPSHLVPTVVSSVGPYRLIWPASADPVGKPSRQFNQRHPILLKQSSIRLHDADTISKYLWQKLHSCDIGVILCAVLLQAIPGGAQPVTKVTGEGSHKSVSISSNDVCYHRSSLK